MPNTTINSLDLLLLAKLIYTKEELISIDAQLKIDKSLWGSFSLRAFGARLGNDKMHFDEFDTGLTEEMATYCIQDCVVTADLLLHLFKQEVPSLQILELEHNVLDIIQEQERLGFYFDIDKARELNAKLLQEKLELSTSLAKMFKPKFLKDGPIKTYKKKSTIKKYLPNNNYKPLLGTKL
jgi:hypothetical protein